MSNLSDNNQLNIEIVRKASKECFKDYPILQQLTFCQAILEGGLQLDRHPSKLALEFNNLFGMKPGKIIITGTANPGLVWLPTRECDKYSCWTEKQPFLSNKDIEDSFKQHEQLFSQLQRYKPLFDCKAFEDIQYVILQCGYATDLDYPEELDVINAKYWG